ncbi:MAG: hypothetical protein H6858_05840 [Rhodospirillales bacterium]|nr:hypothetical protein [Alphaproteobacteria bacterium]MCB9977097.1 hypothetical protein [Rhodospirillales bacterium]
MLLIVLQWFPYTGVFLMITGAPIWTGHIPHIIALTFVCEVLLRKAPKVLLAIPLLPYLFYYFLFGVQAVYIYGLENELQAQNPSKLLEFVSGDYSLVANGEYVKYLKIPVVYAVNSNFPEGYLAYRLSTKVLCDRARSLKDKVTDIFGEYWIFPVSWHEFRSNKVSSKSFGMCELRIREAPQKPILKIVREELKTENPYLNQRQYTFFINEKSIGRFVTATYEAIPLFPRFFIGCGLKSSDTPAWLCDATLRRVRQTLRTYPKATSANNNSDNYFISLLLGIDYYSEDDLQNFKDYPETIKIVDDLVELKKNEKPEDFDQWGLRKDSLYQPQISQKNGYPSFVGVVYTQNEGGPFYSFIEQNRDKIVYLDVRAGPNTNGNSSSIGVYGVCKARKDCTSRTDDYYFFEKMANEERHFQGFFRVGKREKSEDTHNKADNDTRTVLTLVESDELDSK